MTGLAGADRSAGELGCWPLRSSHPDGYSRVGFHGRTVYGHRLALQESLGRPIRAGYSALHRCDNPPCVNPAHLYEGTQADNVRDAVARGRWGSRPLLTADLSPLIELMGVGSAAQRFGVSVRTVYRTLARARQMEADAA